MLSFFKNLGAPLNSMHRELLCMNSSPLEGMSMRLSCVILQRASQVAILLRCDRVPQGTRSSSQVWHPDGVEDHGGNDVPGKLPTSTQPEGRLCPGVGRDASRTT